MKLTKILFAVKSVDLDSWTDEQIQNMIRWGNIKANKSGPFYLLSPFTFSDFMMLDIGKQIFPRVISRQRGNYVCNLIT